MDEKEKKTSLWTKFLDWWKDYFKCCKDVVIGSANDNVNILASGLVYSTLVALIPCLTFLFVFLTSFGALQNFLDLLTELLMGIFGEENARDIIKEISQYSSNAMSLGVFGLVSFLITGLFLVNKIYTVINTIFNTRSEGNTMRRFATFFVFLIVFTFLIALSFALSNTFNARLSALVMQKKVSTTLTSVLKKIASYLIVLLAFFLLLELVPNAKIRGTSALMGAVTGMLAILITNLVFNLLITKMVSYWTIYGTLASVLFILLYFYVLWYIVILIAKLAYVHQFRPDKNTLLGRPQTPERIIAEAVNVLLLIGKKYNAGEGKTSMKSLTKRMAVPISRMQSYLLDFEKAGYILSTNTQHTSFVPAMPLDQIKVKDVLKLLYGASVISSDEIETIGDALSMDFCSAGLEPFGSITIENLLERV